MKVSKKEVQYVAKLARLKFTREEEDVLAGQMSKILGHLESLASVDTQNVTPLTHMSDYPNVFRDDTLTQRITPAEALKNAPDSDGTYFNVPKIINL